MKSDLFRHAYKQSKLKLYAMKKLLLLIVCAVIANFVSGQKSIDALFDKYAGKDGFVTVTVSGDLLKLFSCNDDTKTDNHVPANISEIRILAQEDNNMNVENFFESVLKGVRLNDYEEFMRVKETDQDVRMLVRTEGNRFREFLLIAGGEDNAVIQIKGNMTFREARKFSEDAKKNHGMNIMAEHK
jgi:hypothetical protein